MPCLEFYLLHIQYSSMKSNQIKTVSEQISRLSLINNLKQKILALQHQVQQQSHTIDSYKKSAKVTLINEQEVQIQQLNDENKRLMLLIEDIKHQHAQDMKLAMQGTLVAGGRKKAERDSVLRGRDNCESGVNEDSGRRGKKDKLGDKIDYEAKYYEVLAENDKLRKQMILTKANESASKHKKALNDRSSMQLEKNISEMDRIRQKNYELEVELADSVTKGQALKQRVTELEELLEKALQINKSMKLL